MPGCNGQDRDCNIIPPERGQTSVRSIFAAEIPRVSTIEEAASFIESIMNENTSTGRAGDFRNQQRECCKIVF